MSLAWFRRVDWRCLLPTRVYIYASGFRLPALRLVSADRCLKSMSCDVLTGTTDLSTVKQWSQTVQNVDHTASFSIGRSIRCQTGSIPAPILHDFDMSTGQPRTNQRTDARTSKRSESTLCQAQCIQDERGGHQQHGNWRQAPARICLGRGKETDNASSQSSYSLVAKPDASRAGNVRTEIRANYYGTTGTADMFWI